jgi:hypothetical protein
MLAVAFKVVPISEKRPAALSLMLLSVVVSLLFAGCSEAGETQPVPPSRTHYVAIVDRSTSISQAESESFRALTSKLIDQLSYGDRLDIFVAYAEGRGQGTVETSREMPMARNQANPLPRERGALESAKESLQRGSATVFEVYPRDWTDLVSSLRDAEEQFRGTEYDRKVLVLMSDMLHCVPGDRPTCMDDQAWIGPSSADEIGAAAISGATGLSGACVWVFGAEVDTERDLAVRDFWLEFFRVAGANFSAARYYHGTGSIIPGSCDG